MLDQVFRRSKIEPGINYNITSANCSLRSIEKLLTLVDDALEADHREQSAAHSCARNQAEDDDSKQASSIAAARLLQELTFLCSSHD